MDYKFISAAAGQETADRIEKDSDCFKFEEIDAEALDDLARGAVVLGVETIDYPWTDGLIIYLRQQAGGVVAVLAETGTDSTGLYDLLITKAATIEEANT